MPYMARIIKGDNMGGGVKEGFLEEVSCRCYMMDNSFRFCPSDTF